MIAEKFETTPQVIGRIYRAWRTEPSKATGDGHTGPRMLSSDDKALSSNCGFRILEWQEKAFAKAMNGARY